jgi:CheY-like chemotaxis protein
MGSTATRAIRDDPTLARIPVVAVTAAVMAEEREAALTVGVDDFLTKPIDLDRMCSTPGALCAAEGTRCDRRRRHALDANPVSVTRLRAPAYQWSRFSLDGVGVSLRSAFATRG